MPIVFEVLELKGQPPKGGVRNVAYLSPGDWDDYSFKTSFQLTLFDAEGVRQNLGAVKIGHFGQQPGWSLKAMPKKFDRLPEGWFSLGQDVQYYRKLSLPQLAADSGELLEGLRDLAASEELFAAAKNELVLRDSLLRSVSPSVIAGQYRRVLRGEPFLTAFHFAYKDAGDAQHAPIDLDFQVEIDSRPRTNVHVLIGRNGVGKTTLLHRMAAVLSGAPGKGSAKFSGIAPFGDSKPMPADYFSSVVLSSFSAFDPFTPTPDQVDRTKGVASFYVGMKKAVPASSGPEVQLKTIPELMNDFAASLLSCASQPEKLKRWHKALRLLESDMNFKDMDLSSLSSLPNNAAVCSAIDGRMSSGHFIVLLSITKLVDTVEEKTLVLIDEPESHLHPPLLSAFTRALSDLLHSRNAVAIVATHSPVVLQEVPRSCVWKLSRLGTQGRADRPERETFGENVGVLTREVFSLEVAQSGFHSLLAQEVAAGGTVDSIVGEYMGQLGIEARAVLISLVAARNARQGGGS